MGRITKKQIQFLVKQVGEKYKLPTKPTFAKSKTGKTYYKQKWLNANFNSIYGGWILNIVNKNGGEIFFGSQTRMSTNEFYAYLRGILT